MNWKTMIPRPIKSFIFSSASRIAPTKFKYNSELNYWQRQWENEGNTLKNDHYEKILLAMAEEQNDKFLNGKIVVDFGCGPRGSLCWAKSARMRIGIDILADQYSRFNIVSHDICYICSTEKSIPLPSNYADFVFTLNAMDHVSNFKSMCKELLRILAPGGEFIGSFSLEESGTFAEPQILTEKLVKKHLLDFLEIKSYRIAPPGPRGDAYCHFLDGSPAPMKGHRYLWVRACVVER